MSSEAVSLDPVKAYFTEHLDQHGATARGVGWRNEDTQVLRLSKLSMLIDDQHGPFTVADLGCGYGAFYLHLSEENRKKVKLFTGYDINEKMLREAGKALPSDGVSLICSDKVEERADFVFTSGIFNLKLGCDHESWQQYVFDTILHMYDMADRGIGFNIMTDVVDYKENHIYYQNPQEMLGFCLKNFGTKVVLVHDYPLYEFSVLIRKRK